MKKLLNLEFPYEKMVMLPSFFCTEAFIESILRIGFGHLSFHGTPEQSTLPAATKVRASRGKMVMIRWFGYVIISYMYILLIYLLTYNKCMYIYICIHTAPLIRWLTWPKIYQMYTQLLMKVEF